MVASHDRGSHVTYSWTYGDNGNVQDAIYYDKTTKHYYPTDTSYNVWLNAKNVINSVNSSLMAVHIQRGCWNMAISCDHPRSKNTTFYYQFDPGTVASDACYFVDWSDITSEPSRYLMFGDSTQCGEITDSSIQTFWSSPNRTYFTKDSDTWITSGGVGVAPNITYNITVTNKFMFEGLYDIELRCINKVSDESIVFTTGVTKGPCWWPYVNITRPNPCSPNCDATKPGAKTLMRSDKIIIDSDVVINCTSTQIAYYYWQVYYQYEGMCTGTSSK